MFHADAEGRITLAAGGVDFPNGIVLRADGGTLYVTHFGTLFIRRIAPDGTTLEPIDTGAPSDHRHGLLAVGRHAPRHRGHGPTFRDGGRLLRIELPGVRGAPLLP